MAFPDILKSKYLTATAIDSTYTAWSEEDFNIDTLQSFCLYGGLSGGRTRDLIAAKKDWEDIMARFDELDNALNLSGLRATHPYLNACGWKDGETAKTYRYLQDRLQ